MQLAHSPPPLLSLLLRQSALPCSHNCSERKRQQQWQQQPGHHVPCSRKSSAMQGCVSARQMPPSLLERNAATN
ncbi:unnamed protein product [Lampetra planeri]